MRKLFLVIILVILGILAILIPVGIFGADIALSVSSFSPGDISVSVGTPTVTLASDNSSIDYSVAVTLTTPKLGFLPKSAILTVQFYEGTTTIGNPLVSEFTLGTTVTKTVSGTITLTSSQITTLSSGGSIILTIKGSAEVKTFSVIPIPGLSGDLPDQTLTIP